LRERRGRGRGKEGGTSFFWERKKKGKGRRSGKEGGKAISIGGRQFRAENAALRGREGEGERKKEGGKGEMGGRGNS